MPSLRDSRLETQRTPGLRPGLTPMSPLRGWFTADPLACVIKKFLSAAGRNMVRPMQKCQPETYWIATCARTAFSTR